jgi:hypothetical protein
MTAIVPDTLQGALIVSVIDFFLSFVIISGIGVVLSFFPLLNRVAQWRIGARPSAATAHDKRGSGDQKVVPDSRVDMAAEDDIAAIAAAVLVVMDGAPHRIPPHRSVAARDRLGRVLV